MKIQSLKKTLSTVAIIAFALVALAQPPIPGNSRLTWDASPASDYVTNYTVYITGGQGGTQQFRVATNELPLQAVLSVNGTYTAKITASNLNGESAPSTNMTFHYVPSKPGPPKDLETLSP